MKGGSLLIPIAKARGFRSEDFDGEEDMRRLSKEFPDILFRIDGQGENPADMWKAYYLNGKEQKVFAKITFDDFSPQMLR